MVNNIVTWSPGVTLEDIERQTILAAFRHFRSNKTATAQALGIAIRTLDNKLEKYLADDKEMEKKSDERHNSREDFLKRQRGFTTNTDGTLNIIPGTARHVSRPAESTTERASTSEDTKEGVHMEPAAELAPERTMPLPVGKEVQSMSSKHAAGNRSGKRR